MDVDVDVIVDVVVDCWLYACSREAGRLPLWIEFLALSARIGGAVPRGNSILLEQLKRAGSRQGSSGADRLHADQDVKMSRCENSLTSTSTACDGHLSASHRLDFKAFPGQVPGPNPVPGEMTNAEGRMTKE